MRKLVWWVCWLGAASSPGGKWAMLLTSNHASSCPLLLHLHLLHNYIKYMPPLPTVECMEAPSFPVLIMVFKVVSDKKVKS